jgi:hypothetical protein
MPYKNNEDRNAYRRQKTAEKKAAEEAAVKAKEAAEAAVKAEEAAVKAKKAADKEANRKRVAAFRERQKKMEKENAKSAAVAPSSANTVRFQEDDRASEDGYDSGRKCSASVSTDAPLNR